MRKLFALAILLVSGCASYPPYPWEGEARTGYVPPPQGATGQPYIERPNAYGPGIHSDQYGRPVKVAPY